MHPGHSQHRPAPTRCTIKLLLTTRRKLFFPRLLFLTFSWKKKRPSCLHALKETLFLFVEDSGVTGTVCYGMDCKRLLWSGAGGLASSLTWQVKESRECWTEFTLKVTLQCRLPYLGEKTVRKNVLHLTSWPWQKVRPNSYNRLPPWCTYFFMYPYEHMTAMECKEVCIPLRCPRLKCLTAQYCFRMCLLFWKVLILLIKDV